MSLFWQAEGENFSSSGVKIDGVHRDTVGARGAISTPRRIRPFSFDSYRPHAARQSWENFQIANIKDPNETFARLIKFNTPSTQVKNYHTNIKCLQLTY